jgi:hypothetical protein
MRPALALLSVILVAGAAQAEGAPAVRLAPHRAVYDLSLVRGGGTRSVEGARGRIVFEFTGDPCKGWSLNYRQVTVLESGEAKIPLSDLRNATQEAADGHDFRFRTQTIADGRPAPAVEGRAERTADGVRVALTAPKRDAFTGTGTVLFPSAQMQALVVAARAGQRTLSVKVFDGSDDGHKVYDTLAVIGPPRTEAEMAAAEAPFRQGPMRTMPRWPVTLSYFAPGEGERTPIYTLGFDLYENGVSGALRLDYGEFALKGETTRLDLLPESRADGRDCRP